MLNMNRATLVGHAGRDPEIRDLNNGGKAAVFTLATTEKWTGGDGQPAEATEWHRVVVYGPTVAAVGKMLRKGDRVMVEGRIATRGFTDREGTERAVTEIVVAGPQGMVNMLGGRRSQPGDAAQMPEAGDSGSGEPAPAPEPEGRAEQTPAAGDGDAETEAAG